MHKDNMFDNKDFLIYIGIIITIFISAIIVSAVVAPALFLILLGVVAVVCSGTGLCALWLWIVNQLTKKQVVSNT